MWRGGGGGGGGAGVNVSVFMSGGAGEGDCVWRLDCAGFSTLVLGFFLSRAGRRNMKWHWLSARVWGEPAHSASSGETCPLPHRHRPAARSAMFLTRQCNTDLLQWFLFAAESHFIPEAAVCSPQRTFRRSITTGRLWNWNHSLTCGSVTVLNVWFSRYKLTMLWDIWRSVKFNMNHLTVWETFTTPSNNSNNHNN